MCESKLPGGAGAEYQVGALVFRTGDYCYLQGGQTRSGTMPVAGQGLELVLGKRMVVSTVPDRRGLTGWRHPLYSR